MLFELEVPARKICEQIDLSYPTVLKALTVIRMAIVANSPDLQRKAGEIELAEFYFCGKRKGERRRGAEERCTNSRRRGSRFRAGGRRFQTCPCPNGTIGPRAPRDHGRTPTRYPLCYQRCVRTESEADHQQSRSARRPRPLMGGATQDD